MISFVYNVAGQGKYITIVSTTVETSEPEKEIRPVLQLLELIEEKFLSIGDLVPEGLETESQIFISCTYNATTHFRTTFDDVKVICKKMIESEFDFEEMNIRKMTSMGKTNNSTIYYLVGTNLTFGK